MITPGAFHTENPVGWSYWRACLAELEAPKPGNVGYHAPGHGMQVSDFITSAAVSTAPIAQPRLPVGLRILGAVEATWSAVGCNTNLGIVLLAGPLAAAAQQPLTRPFSERLGNVLASLDVADTNAVNAAIRRANPAGLGNSASHDVAEPASVALREVMASAGSRDRIAYQYGSGFADIFNLGLATLSRSRGLGRSESGCVALLYLTFLSQFPDSHIVRKFGAATAGQVMREAARFVGRVDRCGLTGQTGNELADFDRRLKAAGINPGTSADLTVATLFAERLMANDRAAAGES